MSCNGKRRNFPSVRQSITQKKKYQNNPVTIQLGPAQLALQFLMEVLVVRLENDLVRESARAEVATEEAVVHQDGEWILHLRRGDTVKHSY